MTPRQLETKISNWSGEQNTFINTLRPAIDLAGSMPLMTVLKEFAGINRFSLDKY